MAILMTFNHPDVGSNPANPNYVTVKSGDPAPFGGGGPL